MSPIVASFSTATPTNCVRPIRPCPMAEFCCGRGDSSYWRSRNVDRWAGSSTRLRLHRARPEGLLHPLGDLAQIRVARLAAGASGIEVGLEAVALRPMFAEKLEAGVLDRLHRLRELRLRAADLRQDKHEASFGAAPCELPRKRKRGPQIVARHAGRQKDDLAILGDLGRQIVGETAGVGDDEIGDAILAAQLLQALERTRVDLRLEAGAHAQRAPFDA